jgi:nucleotide-binding universal stress UspA family protein
VVDQEQARVSSTGLEIDTRIDDGDPATVTVDTADSGDFDLLVVGNKGMSGLSRFLTGSVPNVVSHHATCALLIVRTT